MFERRHGQATDYLETERMRLRRVLKRPVTSGQLPDGLGTQGASSVKRERPWVVDTEHVIRGWPWRRWASEHPCSAEAHVSPSILFVDLTTTAPSTPIPSDSPQHHPPHNRPLEPRIPPICLTREKLGTAFRPNSPDDPPNSEAPAVEHQRAWAAEWQHLSW